MKSSFGIFGGTFNPPHHGHLIVAEYVREKFELNRILFMPASIPPHKLTEDIVSPDHRVAMLRLAVEANSRFDVSDIELRRGGVSFTVETLKELTSTYPEERLFLLIGMDNLVDFQSWKDPEKIIALATVVVMTRPGFNTREVPLAWREKVQLCSVPDIEIASREIRMRVRERKSIAYLVPDAVHQYILTHGLYLNPDG